MVKADWLLAAPFTSKLLSDYPSFDYFYPFLLRSPWFSHIINSLLFSGETLAFFLFLHSFLCDGGGA
jgi:hypothetical protein